MATSYRLLDTTFRVSTDQPHLLDYSDAFMEAYRTEPAFTSTQSVAIEVATADTGRPVASATSAPVLIHRSKHPHWSFGGTVTDRDPLTVQWTGRGVTVRRKSSDTWQVTDDAAAHSGTAAESLFHLLRSISLYQRSTDDGPMLHASGVLDRRHRAVLFAGSVSLSGQGDRY